MATTGKASQSIWWTNRCTGTAADDIINSGCVAQIPMWHWRTPKKITKWTVYGEFDTQAYSNWFAVLWVKPWATTSFDQRTGALTESSQYASAPRYNQYFSASFTPSSSNFDSVTTLCFTLNFNTDPSDFKVYGTCRPGNWYIEVEYEDA